jgi:hypothetical protein
MTASQIFSAVQDSANKDRAGSKTKHGAATQFNDMPSAEIRRWLHARKIETSACFERNDLIALAKKTDKA